MIRDCPQYLQNPICFVITRTAGAFGIPTTSGSLSCSGSGSCSIFSAPLISRTSRIVRMKQSKPDCCPILIVTFTRTAATPPAVNVTSRSASVVPALPSVRLCIISFLSESGAPNRLMIRFVQKSVIGSVRSLILRSAIPLISALFVVIVSIV